jgi:hypothetical protein
LHHLPYLLTIRIRHRTIKIEKSFAFLRIRRSAADFLHPEFATLKTGWCGRGLPDGLESSQSELVFVALVIVIDRRNLMQYHQMYENHTPGRMFSWVFVPLLIEVQTLRMKPSTGFGRKTSIISP